MIKRTDEELGIHLKSPDDLDFTATSNLVADILRKSFNDLVYDIVWLHDNEDECIKLEEKYDNFIKFKNGRKTYNKHIKAVKDFQNGLTDKTSVLSDKQLELVNYYLKNKSKGLKQISSNDKKKIERYHSIVQDKSRTLAFYNSDTFEIYALGKADAKEVINKAFRKAYDRINARSNH